MTYNVFSGTLNPTQSINPETIPQICPAMSSKPRHVSTIGKKLLNSNISYACTNNMVNFGSLAAEICCRVWGTPANFNRFHVLASLYYSDVAHRRPTKLCTMLSRLLDWYTIHTFLGALAP